MRPRQFVVLGVVAAASLLGLAVYRDTPASRQRTDTGAVSASAQAPAQAAQPARWHHYTAVEVGGDLLGYAQDESVVNVALESVLASASEEALAYVDLGAKVVTWPVRANYESNLLSPAEIESALAQLVPEMRDAWMITVNGQEVVAVGSQEEAEEAIQEIQKEYKETVLQEAATVEQLQFLESIDFVPRRVVSEEVRTKEEAKEILRYGTDKRIFYTVQRGDTLWDIALRQGLTVEELEEANPGIDPELLQPGQQLSMTVNEPYVHVESTEVQVYTRLIPYDEEIQEDPELWPWQVKVLRSGQYGQKRITARVYRQDGEEVKREILNVEVLKQPVTQVTLRGSRMAPKLGTGEFYWPAKGTITDRFGWTGTRYHTGLDIANATGTPIYAADSGTVTYVGRRGNYGNLIILDHGEGKLETYYGHLSRFAVERGQQVERGQLIGYMGNTGLSTGPHLHFEVRVDGRWRDPLSFYP